MKRLTDKGVDALTTVHKLVGVLWMVCAILVLAFVVPIALSSAGDATTWGRITLLQRVAAYCSVATLVVGFAFGLWTTWGFVRYRQLIGKWVLFLAATALNGPSIIYSRNHNATVVIALTVAEVVVLAGSMAIGVYLERSRHAGTMAGPVGGSGAGEQGETIA